MTRMSTRRASIAIAAVLSLLLGLDNFAHRRLAADLQISADSFRSRFCSRSQLNVSELCTARQTQDETRSYRLVRSAESGFPSRLAHWPLRRLLQTSARFFIALDRDSSACGAGRVKDEEVPHGAIRIACSLLVVAKLPGNMLRPCVGVRVCVDVLQRSTTINLVHIRRSGLPGNSTVGLLLDSFRQQIVRAPSAPRLGAPLPPVRRGG